MLVSTFNPFIMWAWQWAIGSCPRGTDALDPCFWASYVWWLS